MTDDRRATTREREREECRIQASGRETKRWYSERESSLGLPEHNKAPSHCLVPLSFSLFSILLPVCLRFVRPTGFFLCIWDNTVCRFIGNFPPTYPLYYFSCSYKGAETWLKRIRVFESTLRDRADRGYVFPTCSLATTISLSVFLFAVDSGRQWRTTNCVRAHATFAASLQSYSGSHELGIRAWKRGKLGRGRKEGTSSEILEEDS